MAQGTGKKIRPPSVGKVIFAIKNCPSAEKRISKRVTRKNAVKNRPALQFKRKVCPLARHYPFQECCLLQGEMQKKKEKKEVKWNTLGAEELTENNTLSLPRKS